MGSRLTWVSFVLLDFREIKDADKHGWPKMEERSKSDEPNFLLEEDENGTFLSFLFSEEVWNVRLIIFALLDVQHDVRLRRSFLPSRGRQGWEGRGVWYLRQFPSADVGRDRSLRLGHEHRLSNEQ